MMRFLIAGDIEYCEGRKDTYIQLDDADGLDLLQWIGYEPSEFGFLEAPDVAARCRRRLWPIARNMDPAVQRPVTNTRTATAVSYSREAGFLRARTEDLLRLAERAGPTGKILYS